METQKIHQAHITLSSRHNVFQINENRFVVAQDGKLRNYANIAQHPDNVTCGDCLGKWKGNYLNPKSPYLN